MQIASPQSVVNVTIIPWIAPGPVTRLQPTAAAFGLSKPTVALAQEAIVIDLEQLPIGVVTETANVPPSLGIAITQLAAHENCEEDGVHVAVQPSDARFTVTFELLQSVAWHHTSLKDTVSVVG